MLGQSGFCTLVETGLVGTAGWLPLEPFLLSHGENKWDNSDPSVKILVVCVTGLSVAARYNAFESSSGDSVSLT